MDVLTRPVPDNSQVILWLGVGIFAAWSGIVRYLMDKKSSDKSWSWPDATSQVVISGFCGFLGGLYSYEHGYSEVMTVVISGVSGAMSGGLLRWLWLRIFPNTGENK